MKIIPKGTKIHVGLETGFAGMQERANYILSKDYTEEELAQELWMMAKDFAEGYGLYPREEYYDVDIPEEEEDSYVDSIEGWWVYYDENKHSGYTYQDEPDFYDI